MKLWGCMFMNWNLLEYLRNCCEGSAWTAESTATIQSIHSMKLIELLILSHIHCLPVMYDDSTSVKLMSDLGSSLMVHFLLNPCHISFDPLHPANTQCTTLPPSMTAHAEKWSTTLLALIQQKILCKLTTQVLDVLQINYSDSLSLNVLQHLLKQYANQLMNPATPKHQRVLHWWCEQFPLLWYVAWVSIILFWLVFFFDYSSQTHLQAHKNWLC